MISYLPVILVSLSAVLAQNQPGAINGPATTVSTDGFNNENNSSSHQEESWLKQNNRYIFIIFLALILLALIIWYVVRSIRGMRQRLASENQGHMMMIENASGGHHNNNSGFSETVPVDNNGFHKMPDYPGSPQQKQQYTHRY